MEINHRPNTLNQPFRLDEFTFALAKAKGESAGPDEVGYPMIRNLPPAAQINFLELINQEWTKEKYPESWRHSLIVPIPKPDTPGQEVRHYRPISLTCCASKLMERMVNRRLIAYLEEGKRLDDRQHAFRAGRGTNTYFGTLRQALEDAISEDQHIELATLDLSKAYNRAWMPGVVNTTVDRLGP